MQFRFLNMISIVVVLAFSNAISSHADIIVVEDTDARRYTDSGRFLGTVVSSLSTPLSVIQSPKDGRLLVSQLTTGEIHKYEPDGEDVGAILKGFADWQPAGLAWNDNRLYAASIKNKAISSYALDAGKEDGDANTPHPQRVLEALSEAPNGLCSAGIRGGVYFTTSDEIGGEGTGKGCLGYWSGEIGSTPETIYSFPAGSRPRGVVENKGEFYVALLGSGKVVKVTEKGTTTDFLINLMSPVGVGIKSGHLYVSSYLDRTVRAYDLVSRRSKTVITARNMPQYFCFVPSATGSSTGSVLMAQNTKQGSPAVRLRANLTTASLPFMSWDTEGGERAQMNLLRAPITLSTRDEATERVMNGTGKMLNQHCALFSLSAPGTKVSWTVKLAEGGIRMVFSVSGQEVSRLKNLVLTIPLDPTATATVPMSDQFSRDGRFELPALVYAPDLGAMRVTCATAPNLSGSWQGSRQTRSTTITLNLPVPSAGKELILEFKPWHLQQPKSVKDASTWKGARRGWMNLLQVNSHRVAGDFAHGIGYPEEPAGVWANNLVSDPVGSTVFWLADHVLLIPKLAPDVSATALLRRTVDLWMNDGISPEGQVFYVWRGGSPADANPAVLIGAWAYVEASGDMAWFRKNADRLAFVSRYMENRDIDQDGLVESPQSGNRNSHSHGETAWDCISSGHKNAYVNALAYRAWRGLARLHTRAGNTKQAAYYNGLALKLKSVYRNTFYNPETGWLGWWRSADGELHDIWSDMPTSMAIMYGLISANEGRVMLDKYWQALQKIGFSNFELGIPLNIKPIPPSLMLTGFGGKLDDGSDNYGKWLNGGTTLSNTSFWLAANYSVGRYERADMILNKMLARQKRSIFPNGGAFQNGIVDNPPNGAECMDWNGEPCGYEGHLVYSWTWMQSLLLRDPETRQRVFGVLQ